MGIFKKRNKLTVSSDKSQEPYYVPREDLSWSDMHQEDRFKENPTWYWDDDAKKYYYGDYYIMPEVEVNANLSDKDILHKSDKKINDDLQESIDIARANPEIYGKVAKLKGKYLRRLVPEHVLTGEQFDELYGEGASKRLGGVYQHGLGLMGYMNGYPISTMFPNINYNKDTKRDNLFSLPSIRIHEMNHMLYDKYLGSATDNSQWQKILDEAYNPYKQYEGNFYTSGFVKEDFPEYLEQAATNAQFRQYFKDRGIDYNNYDFVSWKGNSPKINLPYINGYTGSFFKSISNYINMRFSEIIAKEGKDPEEAKRQITDEVNQRIRAALSTIAYNQNQNNNSPLYAKSGGRLVPKGQWGLGEWFLRQLRRIVPQIEGTAKKVEQVTKKGETATKLQKGVERAQKISKSTQFKELVNGLELEDRVGQELISKYEGLDPKTQSTEREMLLRLMKNNQIHSITDFDLAVDKVHSNKMGGNPNILGIKTISDLNTPFAETWESKQREKQEYDRALGTFEKVQDYPEIDYTAYSVPETRQGQQDLLTVMKGQYNKKIQPWCIIETDKKTGELTPAAIERWDKEYAGPKFALMDKKGKIRYFASGDSGWFDLKDKQTGAIRGTQPIIKTGNRSVYEMFHMPLNGIRMYPNLSPYLPKIQDMVSMDLRNGWKVDKLSDAYGTSYWINRPQLRNSMTRLIFPSQDALKDEYTSQFMSKSRRDYGSGPVPGTEGKWYKTASGKWRFAEGIHDNHFLYFDESGNLLKHHGTLFHPEKNMMLQQRNGHVGLYRGKDQESLLKFDLDGSGFEDAEIFGVTPLYEQLYSDGQLHPQDYSGYGEDAADLPSALKKFGFQLPELKEGGVFVQKKN